MNTKLGWALLLPFAVALSVSAQADKPGPKPIVSQFSGHNIPTQDHALMPAESAKSFTVPDDLEIEQVLAEPIVRQPVFLNFDERGRMWVVQYLQYPAPAGLKEVSRDKFWRAVYDKIPKPPPRGMKGLDKITIHEDTDGDGLFDQHKTFVDGLNIATSCVKGRGGVWVLHPPYLLFYPDKNDDDVPDGDPVVHLEGFGLEDTHSVVNSLRWGPDGWLYAAQGSTVTANVRVRAGRQSDGVVESRSNGQLSAQSLQHPNAPSPQPVYSQGQNIWRYHPERHLYELFAEGGGNAFGVEFDDKGRLFSGHNGGDTRGFHYMQGAYLRKGFEKHGELSNPYAFGYFPHMDGTKGERFTHNFILYHGGALPERYNGKLFGVEPLQGRVVLSDITPDGSTFKTRDLERVVTSSDSWFRPVDIKTGPDGAIYIADWYDRQVTHTRNQEGHIDKEHGRIYRLKPKAGTDFKWTQLFRPVDGRPAGYLTDIAMRHGNSWFRQQALRLVADGQEKLPPAILETIRINVGQPALEALWLLATSAPPGNGSAIQNAAPVLLRHSDAFVRQWTVRLLGDDTSVPHRIANVMAELSVAETNVEVRAQLACSAKRLPAHAALPIVANLLHRGEDAKDPRLPLLCWWAIESKCESDRDAVLKLFEDSPFWTLPMVEQHLLGRLMRRFAAAGTRKDLLTCAKLLRLSPSREHSAKLMGGFEDAFKGRALTGLPDELIAAMARHNVGSDAFKLRTGDTNALARALALLADTSADKKRRQEFIDVLGEVRPRAALDPLLRVADNERDPQLRKAALAALPGYDDPRIAATVVKDYNAYAPEVRAAALTLVSSRAAWTLAFAEAVEAGRIKPGDVPLDTVRQWQRHKSDKLAALIPKLWPTASRPTTAAMQTQIRRLAEVIRSGEGDPYGGQKIFNTACASCHTLFARGGKVGPDLTTYQRGDLDAMLLHIVNPSAEIREGYENLHIETTDDRSLTGFLVERDDRLIVLRGPDGQNITLEPSNIAEMRAAGLSLMPEGLLDNLTDQQARDLFAYLRSTQPLAN
jgi:putative heme-binding domain-containing protein